MLLRDFIVTPGRQRYSTPHLYDQPYLCLLAPAAKDNMPVLTVCHVALRLSLNLCDFNEQTELTTADATLTMLGKDSTTSYVNVADVVY